MWDRNRTNSFHPTHVSAHSRRYGPYLSTAGLVLVVIMTCLIAAGYVSERVVSAGPVEQPFTIVNTLTATRYPVYLPAVSGVRPPASPTPTATPPRGSSSVTQDLTDFGLVFVNSAEDPSGAARISRGVETGATFDRFPVYWSNIERSAGQFDWSRQDAALRANEAQGLDTLVILLGTPGQYFTQARASAQMVAAPPVGGSYLRLASPDRATTMQAACAPAGPPPPRGLFDPIFADGSDIPGVGKAINENNPWARFVHLAVNRYRPGGDAGLHVRHWEIWNEPDLCQFWSGTATDYARLLKVAYLVIKQSDPEAVVIWGGLAHFENGQFLYDLINTLHDDPLAAANEGFFDAAGTHHYAVAWNSYIWTDRIRKALDAAGWQDKPIWVTESGVPVCSDFPFPGSCPSPWRGSPEEQASYIWQNVGYTRLAGGGPIFQFNLHDDCGNVVAPDSPDGFGLVKNESTSFCSPDGAERRLAYTAYQLAIRYFQGAEVLWADIQSGVVRRMAFYDPVARERRLLTFALTGEGQIGTIPATSTEARQIAIDGTETLLIPVDAEYRVELPGATNRNQPDGNGGYGIGIYGRPYVLVEKDTLPPSSSMGSLPAVSPPELNLSWQVDDLGSGVAAVAVWYRVGDGQWQVWRSGLPAHGSASFTGNVGQSYRFGVMAVDRAGNTYSEPMALAETRIEEQQQP